MAIPFFSSPTITSLGSIGFTLSPAMLARRICSSTSTGADFSLLSLLVSVPALPARAADFLKQVELFRRTCGSNNGDSHVGSVRRELRVHVTESVQEQLLHLGHCEFFWHVDGFTGESWSLISTKTEPYPTAVD